LRTTDSLLGRRSPEERNDRTKITGRHAPSAFYFESSPRNFAKKTQPRPREFVAALGFFLGEGTHRVVQSMRRLRFQKFHILIFKSFAFSTFKKFRAPLHEFHFNFQKFRI
jgi:hypothetical protein